MTGVFGFDPQHTRTVIAVAEGPDGAVHTRLVGDGRRQLVPNACGPGPLWGSLAAEAGLRALDTDGVDLADHLFCWQRDPLTESFLRGTSERLFSYLGQTVPTNRYGYHVCLATPRAAGEVRELCMKAGLTSTSTVHPTDALVCRWLSDPAAVDTFDRKVVAVACGEAATAVAGYQVDRWENGVWVEGLPGIQGVTATGTGAVSAELARAVLQRCHEGVPAAALLAVVDGTWEFGATLRARPPGEELEWDGALADRLFTPLRLTRGRMAQWPVAAGITTATATLVSELSMGAERPVVLVGGIGAVWPFVADALRDVGSVWQSRAPEYDIAFGAAWWPAMRGSFATAARRSGDASTPSVAVVDSKQAVPADPEPVGSPGVDGPDEIPPWLRNV